MHFLTEREQLASQALRVLIVEDEPIVADELQYMLAEMGHICIGWANSYPAYTTLIASQRPHLVLLDIYLGKKNTGFDIARHLTLQQIPFLFLSAHADALTVEEATGLKPSGYLLKPFDARRLFISLELCIGQLKSIDRDKEALPEIFLNNTLEEIERAHICTALAHSRGRIWGKEGAAQRLGLHPNTLQSRLDKLGINKKD